MTHTNPGMQENLVTLGLQVPAEGNILRTLVAVNLAFRSGDLNQGVPEIGILKGVENLLGHGKEAHTGIRNLHVLLSLNALLILGPGINIILSKELEGTSLAEMIRVPLTNNSQVLAIGHHVHSGNNPMVQGAVDKLLDLSGIENNVGINGKEDVILEIVEGLLLMASENIQAESLHTGKRNEAGIPSTDHEIKLAALDQLRQSLRPTDQKVITKPISGKTDDYSRLTNSGSGGG